MTNICQAHSGNLHLTYFIKNKCFILKHSTYKFSEMSISNIKHVHHRLKPGSVSISPYPTLKFAVFLQGAVLQQILPLLETVNRQPFLALEIKFFCALMSFYFVFSSGLILLVSNLSCMWVNSGALTLNQLHCHCLPGRGNVLPCSTV